MNDKHISKLNYFFVQVFNDILAWEEKTLKTLCSDSKLSVREIHVLEAVSELSREGKNTMANVAEMLAVTRGSLSTAVDVLVKKGFLERSYTPEDRRVIYVTVTESGEKVNEIHRQFHEEMIRSVGEKLTDTELENLTAALDKLSEFFKSKKLTRK